MLTQLKGFFCSKATLSSKPNKITVSTSWCLLTILTASWKPGNIYLQLKATDSPALSADGDFFSFSISIKDYNAWIIEPMPVFLILYDVKEERAYWQYVQAYFGSTASSRPRKGAASVTVRLPVGNRFDETTVDYVRMKKQSVLDQLTGATKHVL